MERRNHLFANNCIVHGYKYSMWYEIMIISGILVEFCTVVDTRFVHPLYRRDLVGDCGPVCVLLGGP